MAKPERIDVMLQADYGTGFIQDRRGRRVPAPIGSAIGIELADVPDIDRPDKRVTVRVARRVDPLLAILDPRTDGPGRQQYVAAERFRRDVAIADGARGVGERLGVSGGDGSVGPSGNMIDAQERVRYAWNAMRGPENRTDVADVVRVVVLGMATLETVQTLRRCRRQTARLTLIFGLERLTSHYEGADGKVAKSKGP